MLYRHIMIIYLMYQGLRSQCTTDVCLVFRVAQAYVNQRKLDHEVKTLQVQASQFSKQTAQWISMVEGFNQALKVCCVLWIKMPSVDNLSPATKYIVL